MDVILLFTGQDDSFTNSKDNLMINFALKNQIKLSIVSVNKISLKIANFDVIKECTQVCFLTLIFMID
jgi:hypothetical protein